MREFLVCLRVRLGAAGGDVEIVQLDNAGPALEGDAGVAAVVLAAPDLGVLALEGQAREDGDAVVALLAVDQNNPLRSRPPCYTVPP